ncbi:hypothetical protein KY312_00960 [Candidatus Woesearchaeota archaeon]|nr:hypothetical protein [Candidatus Woesearchaeota archaeon]
MSMQKLREIVLGVAMRLERPDYNTFLKHINTAPFDEDDKYIRYIQLRDIPSDKLEKAVSYMHKQWPEIYKTVEKLLDADSMLDQIHLSNDEFFLTLI